jgi:hypothetical protein
MNPRGDNNKENSDRSMEQRITATLQQAVKEDQPSITFIDVWVPSKDSYRPSGFLKRKKRILIIIALCIAIFPAAGYSYYNGYSINDLFTEIKFKIEHPPIDNNRVLVTYKSENYVIAKEFVLYKANIEGIAKINGVSFRKTNMEILDEILGNKLFYQYAVDQGYTVSMKEIEDRIAEMKHALIVSDHPKEAKEFIAYVINLTGLTEEEYWKSPEVIQAFREELIENKLFKKELLYDIISFKKELLSKNKNSLQINKKMLNAF